MYIKAGDRIESIDYPNFTEPMSRSILAMTKDIFSADARALLLTALSIISDLKAKIMHKAERKKSIVPPAVLGAAWR